MSTATRRRTVGYSNTMKITPPRLPAHLEDSDSWAIVPEATIERVMIDGGELIGRTMPSISIDETRMNRVALTQSKLERLLIRDSTINGCDFSAVGSPEVSLQRVGFTAGRMTGWDLSRGLLRDITFADCKLNLANFRFTRLTNVHFKSCVLTGADFLQAHLTKVSFDGCDLDQADFNHATLHDVDFRTSQLTGLRGWQYLRGATINHAQLITAAPYLAAELGIIVN